MCTDSSYLSEHHLGKSACEKSTPLSPNPAKREEKLARNKSGVDTSDASTPSLDVEDNDKTEKACTAKKNGSEITKDLKNNTPEVENKPSTETVAKQLEGTEICSGTVIQIKAAEYQDGKGTTASQCSKPNIQSVSDRIKQLRRSQSESIIVVASSAPSNVTRRSKFGEAYKMYRELQTLSESPSPSGKRRNLVSVKERAQLFGQK